MKIFSSIMALYMMVLFLIPCADKYEKEILYTYEHANEVAHENSHDHTKTTDMCSPFCFCSCCGIVSGVVLEWSSSHISKIISFDLPKRKVYYRYTFIPRYFGEIWQPPKINA